MRSSRGGMFVLCRRSQRDARFPKYPALPRSQCAGYDPPPADVPDVPESSTPVSILIRVATSDDVPVIRGFIEQLADYERLRHEVLATDDGLRDTLFGPRPAAEVLIATVDGQDVGFALFFQTYSTFLARPGIHLEDLFVVPEARGAGVGRALLARVAALAEARGCGRLEWAVLTWNEPAIGFYRRLGAIPLDEWQTYRLDREGIRALAASTVPPPTHHD
ncbi:GNAT family N-acetyltransferase [Luteitalea sp. TBR-22]|uniref:GNAT family N-acetyltransferase n=1 Tax=Luteitalea sp. TBR-22 TaxID=2802971 RepID=UPI001EF6D58C|nr:GNAT family N-acetyltransferase [Luteitalea sp. TBR-22]